jgi:hypothetical protein
MPSEHFPEDPALRLEPGAQLGCWRVAERQGFGGYGIVYRALRIGQEHSDSVALKLARYPWDRRFAREAELLSRDDPRPDLEHQPRLDPLLRGWILRLLSLSSPIPGKFEPTRRGSARVAGRCLSTEPAGWNNPRRPLRSARRTATRTTRTGATPPPSILRKNRSPRRARRTHVEVPRRRRPLCASWSGCQTGLATALPGCHMATALQGAPWAAPPRSGHGCFSTAGRVGSEAGLDRRLSLATQLRVQHEGPKGDE